MLGRLTSLKHSSSGQEFPDNWENELRCLKSIGASCLEWLVVDTEKNPLYDNDLSKYPITSINVHALVMERLGFFELDKICLNACRQGIFRLVLPMMEASSIKSDSEIDIYQELSKKYPKLSFSFETELSASEILPILNMSNNFFVTYDTGNTTCYNFDHEKEIQTLRNKIDNVHLKDRIRSGGPSVEPFTGNTDFKLIFGCLKKIQYNGAFILETFRGPSGKEVDTVSRHIERFKCLI